MSARKAEGFMISPAAGGASFALPPLIECNQILASRFEIPPRNVALNHSHLRSVASQILLGTDMIRVHKDRQQMNDPHDAPFAQRLDLGWVVVGEVCTSYMNLEEEAPYIGEPWSIIFGACKTLFTKP